MRGKRVLNSFGMLRIVALVALFGLATSLIPDRAAAKSTDGYYESSKFGYSVEYDDTVWVGTELEGEYNEGIGLENEITWANIRGVEMDGVDEEACLEYMAESFNDGETMREFRRAPRATELPENELGGMAALYSLEMGEDDPMEGYMYLHCISIADDQAALMIMMVAPVGAYEEALPTWSDLLAGIEPGNGPVDQDDTPEKTDDDPTSASYMDDELGLSITWDDSIWTGTELDDDSDSGVEFERELSFGYVLVKENDGYTPEECVDTLASSLEESESLKRVRKAPSEMERIEGDPAGANELYTVLSTESPLKLAFYLECRQSADSELMVVINLSTEASDYDAERESWQQLVDGIEVSEDASPESSDSGDRDTERDDESTDDAGNFTGENYDFTLAYDPEFWTAEVSTDEGYDWLGLTSDYGQVIVLATESDVDLDGCIDTLLEDEQQYAEGDIEPAPRSYDLPATSRDAQGDLYTYEGTSEDGATVDSVVYFDCRYIEEGDSILAVTFVTTPDLYEDALPKVEAILETIEVA